MMNKTQYQQHYKRGINNNINNYNNNSYYSSNYYYNYNHKKNYISNSNNYNEERKKNNYYNNKINDGYNNEYNGYDDYNNQYEEYNEYDNGYNNNYIYPQNKKKKVYNRYNNINNNININNINLSNNFYDNNEETKIKTVNEIKQKKEVMKLKINLKEDKYLQLIIYKEDNIDEVVKEFCNLNNIDKELVNPLINKIKQSLKQIELITNNKIKLSRDSVLLLEKAKKRIQNK